jgi:uncharacterized protein (DUF1800 family)
MNRRVFLGLAGASLAACDGVRGYLARELGAGLPGAISPPEGATVDPARHLLDRAAWGPWPGDVDRVRAMGAEAWIDEQLEPGSLSDLACTVMARRFESIGQPAGELFEFKAPVVQEELARHTLLRAVYAQSQLHEVMVAFWTDHFNIAIGKAECAWLKTADDRDVIRTHALGRFSNLLRASALSPAMLVYLDGTKNRRASGSEVPNENYARELMELHTLGVGGGYTQRDVMEAARCLTGWQVRTGWNKGSVEFRRDLHDDGDKRVLGHTIPAGGGEADLDALLDILVGHPSTTRYLATKLCRWFIADDPPERAVADVATTFAVTRGDLRATVRAVLTHDSFTQHAQTKLKRPFRFVVSALRAVGAETHTASLLEWLSRMGHAPFEHPTPDGYPTEPHPWLGTVLWRWNFANALAQGQLADTRVRWGELATACGSEVGLVRHLLGRDPTPTEVAAFRRVEPTPQRAALVLCSPAFQAH